MTRNTIEGHYVSFIWNEYNLNTLTRINWRASLVPAAAVIPAPIVYIIIVVVKKLVVGFRNAEVKAHLNGVARHPLPVFG